MKCLLCGFDSQFVFVDMKIAISFDILYHISMKNNTHQYDLCTVPYLTWHVPFPVFTRVEWTLTWQSEQLVGSYTNNKLFLCLLNIIQRGWERNRPILCIAYSTSQRPEFATPNVWNVCIRLWNELAGNKCWDWLLILCKKSIESMYMSIYKSSGNSLIPYYWWL